MANKIQGTGHRKSSRAKVNLVSGKGKITVNGRDVNEYFVTFSLIVQNIIVYICLKAIMRITSIVMFNGKK